MKYSQKLIIPIVFFVCFLLVAIIIFSPYIKRGLKSARETIEMEIRNERLWEYRKQLQKTLSGKEFSDVTYIVTCGNLLISGSVPDNETFEKMLQAIFSKPDELVYHVEIRLMDIYGEANVEFKPHESKSSNSKAEWILIRRGYYFSNSLPGQNTIHTSPQQEYRIGTDTTVTYYDRDGNVIESIKQLQNDPNTLLISNRWRILSTHPECMIDKQSASFTTGFSSSVVLRH